LEGKDIIVSPETIKPLFYVSPQSLFRGVQRSAVTRTQRMSEACGRTPVCVRVHLGVGSYTQSSTYL